MVDSGKHFGQYRVQLAVQVVYSAVDNATVERSTHTFLESFLWVNDVSTCPQLHVVKYERSLLIFRPVQLLKDSTKVHAHNSPKTESNQSDSFSIRKICFQQECSQQLTA
jgi:hypothetical protein